MRRSRRRPAILLVDELAHSNLIGGEPPPRHPKRWQDIEELLDAGIDVWTTVNVQHLESLNDVVAQITGVRAARDGARPRSSTRRTKSSSSTCRRTTCSRGCKAGKVYVPDEVAHRDRAILPQAEPDGAARARAAAHRRPRRRCGARVARGRSRHVARLARARPRPRRDRAGRAGRAARARRQAHGGRAGCRLDRRVRRNAVAAALSESERNRRIDLLRLAESLGAETVTLDGPTAARALPSMRTRAMRRACSSARRSAAAGARWLRPSTATELVRRARGFDVVTIARPERTADTRPSGAARRGRCASRSRPLGPLRLGGC